MIWAAIINSRIARAIGAALVALGALFAWGAAKKRQGAAQARSEAAAQDARETIQAHEVRNEVEADVARGGDARDRLRADWKE